MLPILYSFRRCPYAMRARMALKYCNVQVEHREILLKNKPQSMLQFSPKGTVPVLVVDDFVIDESLEVMQWALNLNDKDDWLLCDQADLRETMNDLIQKCDVQFKPQLDRYKYSDRFELSEEQYRNQAEWFLSELNTRLENGPYLMGDKISMADVAIFPFIRQCAFVNKNWFDNNEYTLLQKWLEKLLIWPVFLSIMQKVPLWSDDVL